MKYKTKANSRNHYTNIFKLNLYGLKAKIGLIRSDLSDAKYLII